MDPNKTMDESSAEGKESEGKTEQAVQVHKTPVRPGKGVKRKHQSPATPSGKPSDEEKPGSAKKRRKSASSTPLSRVASPGTTLFKPAMTERQQMALLLQMTDPNKQHSGGDETPPISSGIDSTPKGRVSRKNERGETPLHIACIKGDVKTATSLINQGAGVNEVDNAGWTPLHEACNYGHNKVVVLLLRHGANVNARGMDGDSPLHDAAGNAHIEVVKTLLEHGSDPNQANDKGLTPAGTCKDAKILKLLSESSKVKEEERQRKTAAVDAGGEEKLHGEEGVTEEEEDEDVFETKAVVAVTPDRPVSTGFRPKAKPETEEGERESQPLEEGPLPQKVAVAKKQLKDDFSSTDVPTQEHSTSSTAVADSCKDSTVSGGASLTKLIGKATPFFSDISSSESESELPEVKFSKKRSSPVADQVSDEGKGRDEQEKMETDSVEQVRDTGAESPSAKEEAKVKISHKDQGLETSSSLLASESGMKATEDVSKTLPEQLRQDYDGQEVPQQQTLTSVAISPDNSRSASQKTVESTDLIPVPSTEDALNAAKNLYSPVHSSPETKLSQPLLSRDEIAGEECGTSERERYVVSIPLSVVKLSRKLKCSREYRDSSSPHTAVGDMKMDTSSGEEGVFYSKEKQSITGKELHIHMPSMLLSRSDSRSDAIEHLRSSAGRTLERRDSTSSQDSRSSTSGERKHSRKPQHVYSSKKLFKESKREDERGRGDSDDVTDSFSISVEFGVLPSQQSKLMRQGSVSSPTSLTVTSSSPGLSVQSEGKITVEDSASVLLRPPPVGGGYEESKNDSGDNSKSTVISFSTSLPIHFCNQPSLATSQSKSTHGRDVCATPSSIKTKSMPMLLESVKSSTSAPVTPLKRERSSGQQQEPAVPREQDILSLPPKKRFRTVQRSSVVQQRRMRPHAPTVDPPHFQSFLMCSGQYRSKQVLQPTNPKTVYPPLHSAMYKFFSEQENERVRLSTAHMTELDRIVLSMEQELLRAYQRASKSPNPLSVCSVLLEQLLPKNVYELSEEVTDQSGCIPPALDSKPMSPAEKCKENGVAADPLDIRLLSGLLQDVWDKFFELKESVLIRQRHETEALWLVQQELWRQRLNELGFVQSCSLKDVPPSHVPLASYLTRRLLVGTLL